MVRNLILGLAVLAEAIGGAALVCRSDPSKCPGYKAENVVETDTGITADLSLAGPSCNSYGTDLKSLKLDIEYETKDRLHVKISDAENNVYQVHESIFPRPKSQKASAADSNLLIDIVENPFSFAVSRKGSAEVLFNTTGSQLIMETQYVRLRTSLPQDPNLYGLGEHSDSFRLQTKGYKRTLWNAESPFIPRLSNLYGTHPVYFEHRGHGGTHGVFLLNANGMDIKIDQDESGQYLEYNAIGGIVDLYFLAGPTPNDVSKQYAEVAGLPVMQQYWTFGYHQCKFGWKNIDTYDAVVKNYSDAGIPLETLWGDIDYMQGRADFTLDPVNFPLDRYRQLVDYLHEHDQQIVMMVDPAILRSDDYPPYVRGKQVNAFLKADDGSDYYGAQWAGTSVWPDWFAPNTSDWWQAEIMRFFDADDGVNVDGLWNDMNEVSNFCFEDACPPIQVQDPSNKPKPGSALGLLEHRELVIPPYKIGNHQGNLSHQALSTNVTNFDGSVQYDTHSLYGNGMVTSTRGALLKRRPGLRPFVLTRASYAGMGTRGAHWFGDNNSTWSDYRIQIAQMLAFTSIHQVSMVGSDVCGFNGDAEVEMCARWAMLGALAPFYRNHADQSAPNQEFYRWPLVAQTAKKAIDMRYRLIDYFYTHMQRQTETGEPAVKPLFYIYPEDSNTFPIDLQYFYGDSLLVSPVTDDDSQDVTFYLPDDVFYDFWTGEQVQGEGKTVTRTGVDWDDIPLHVRGGSILALRAESANTTAALRTKNFSLLVAPGRDGKASGSLYLDDGKSLDPGDDFSKIDFTWDGTTLRSGGTFGYETDVRVESVVFMGNQGKGKATVMTSEGEPAAKGSWPLTEAFEIKI